MQFPDEPTFAERLALLTETFSLRFGAMTLVSVLFLTKDTPAMKLFGGVVAGWIVFEILLKYVVIKRKR